MRRLAILLALFAATFAAWTPPAAAQSVLLRVSDAETAQPVFGALAYLVAADGTLVRTVLTDERGRALLLGLPGGEYSVRVELIGKATTRTGAFLLRGDTTVVQDIRMAASAIPLEGISVEAEGGRCSVRPAEGMIVAAVWDEARKALTAAAFTDDQEVYRYQTLRYERSVDRDTKRVREEQTSRSGGYLRTPFESRPAADLLDNGFVQSDAEGDLYFAPDANVLLSDAFLDTHCFKLERGGDEAAGLVGLAFEPVGERNRVPDIAGTLWIDPASSELRWLDYRYQNLNADLTSPDVGGRVDFRRLPNGTWIVPEWWIRMPTIGYTRDGSGRRQPFLESYRVSGATVTQVQEEGGRTLVEAETATIRGIVLDSLGVDPVRGANIGVVGSNQTVFSDAEGRFAISGLVDGTYDIAYTHPSLQNIGAAARTATQQVARGEVTALTLRLPSRADVLFAMCRGEERPEGTAVLLGWVRDAITARTIPGALVAVRWGRYTILAEGTPDARLGPELVDGFETTADDDGFYRFCSVPEDELLTITGTIDSAEPVSDTLRIPDFAGASAHVIDVRRGGR